MLKNKMKNDKIYGIFIKMLDHPAINLYAKQAGIDFLFYDLEHGMLPYHKLHDLLLMGNREGVASLVRVAQLARADIAKALDCGACGVMVPMVETKEQAEQLVRFAKYPPLGKRSYAGGANTQYRPSGNHLQNMEQANAEVLAIAQIETVEGIHNAKEILEVEGIDAVIIGPADLCISYGMPEAYDHPVIQQQVKAVATLAKQYGKGFGMIGNMRLMKQYKDELSIFISAIDANIIRDGFQKAKQELDDL